MSNLLEWYIKGFKDEKSGTSSTISEDNLENLSYDLGAFHALRGDDVKNIGYLSDEEILNVLNKMVFEYLSDKCSK